MKYERMRSPYAARIEALWSGYREEIIHSFPRSKSLPKNIQTYINEVTNIYTYDAYNSLSIEGYKVSPQLIEQVENNKWDPDQNREDEGQRNALAARGYYEAHQDVMRSLVKILEGSSPGEIIQYDLQTWYRSLFAPNVRARILSPDQLIGYRKSKVYIRNSRHTPPPHEALYDAMDAFFHCLKNEPNAGVRAILGHYLFVYIHPYMDGNGRLARFLMNAMLASGGYSWTVVRLSRRQEYLNALGKVDVDGDIRSFATFLKEEMESTKTILEK